MPDFLHDPRFYGPLATSCGVLITLTLWLLSQRRKQLSYEILSNASLVNLLDDIKDRLTIQFDGAPVYDLHLVVVKIVNSGDVAIRSAEYEGKIAVVFSGDATILLADVEETRPKNLHERSLKDKEKKPLIESFGGQEVVLRPVMMNKGDYVKVRLLVNNPPGEPQLVGHIEGIHEFKRIKEQRMLPMVLANLGALTMVAALILLDPSRLFCQPLLNLLPYALMFLAGYIILLFGIYVRKQNKDALHNVVKPAE